MKPTYGQLCKVQDVFFHESCPDGTAAAMVCAAAFHRAGLRPSFHPLQYDTDLMARLEPRPGQLFVDITPPRERWAEWREAQPVVLDHHESAREATEGLGGVYGLNETHSGAMLAYDFVLSAMADGGAAPRAPDDQDWRAFATLAMVRDTWKEDPALWGDACAQAAALQAYGSKALVEKVLESGTADFTGIMELGRILLESSLRKAEKVADGAYSARVSDGQRTYGVAMFNCTEKLISDAANMLIDRGADVAVGYFYVFEDEVQKLCASVRTNGTVSASAVAEAYGGGGHARAAGFRIPGANDTPPSTLLAYIEHGVAAAAKR